MEHHEIKALCNQHVGLRHALEEEFGNRIPFDALEVEPVGTINIKLLAATLREYREVKGTRYPEEPNLWQYQVENLYIVWDDGRVEKSDRVDYRCVGTVVDDWTGESSSYDIYTGNEDEEAKPIASHFVTGADVKHLILLEHTSNRLEGGLKKIERVTIKIFTPDAGVDIVAQSRKIMEVWESEGHIGLSDYSEDPTWDED